MSSTDLDHSGPEVLCAWDLDESDRSGPAFIPSHGHLVNPRNQRNCGRLRALMYWCDRVIRASKTLSAVPRLSAESPVVVGGTGGSGTRSVTALLHAAGVYMGGRVTAAGDAIDFAYLGARLKRQIIRKTRAADYDLQTVPLILRSLNLLRLRLSARAHLSERSSEADWGWKIPSSLYQLPFLVRIFPALRLVHLVRDGRDMAFSTNQNQPTRNYHLVVRQRYEDPGPVRSMRLWAKGNLEVYRWATRTLGRNYVLVRFEDLCNNPVQESRRMLEALGLQASSSYVSRQIQAPDSIGRYQTQPTKLVMELERVGGDALRCFGYLPARQGRRFDRIGRRRAA